MEKKAEYYFNEKTGLYRKRVKNPLTGKWQGVTAKTLPVLYEKIRELEASWVEGARAKDKPFVAEYCRTWYELNTAELSDKGREGYRASINLHICPVIGDKLLADVTGDDVRKVLAVMQRKGLASATQSRTLRLMRRIFGAAEDSGLIARDPTRNVKAGGRPPAEKTALTPEQEQTLLRAVAGLRVETFCRIALHAGLRREEILALKWDCVHLDGDAPYIAVRRALRWPQNNRPEISDKLKSRAARRDVPIPDALVEHLRGVREAAGGDFVLADLQGGALSYSGWSALWGAVRARSERTVRRKVDGREVEIRLRVGDKVPRHDVTISIDFPVTPHQLRHTYISRLILAGVDLKTVQYLAGHASVQLTLDVYTHLMGHRPEDLIGAVRGALPSDPNGDPKGAENASSDPGR